MTRILLRSCATLAVATAITGGLMAVSAPAYASNASCGTVTTNDSTVAANLNTELTGSLSNAMTAYRVSCARAIIDAVNARGLPQRASVIAVTTAIVETTLQNTTTGDLDSVGLFQQRSGWGTVAERMDPATSTNLFLNVMVTVSNWQTKTIGTVCQAVQRSAYGDLYQLQAADGQRIVTALKPASTPTPTPQQPVSNPSGATLSLDGYLEVFAKGSDNTLQHWYAAAGGAWYSDNLGGSIASDPVTTVDAAGYLQVFARGTDGTLKHWYAPKGGSWSNDSLGGTISGPITTTADAAGYLQVFAKGTDNSLRHWYAAAGSAWNLNENLGSNITGSLSATIDDADYLQVFARGTDGGLHHWYAPQGGGWSNDTLS